MSHLELAPSHRRTLTALARAAGPEECCGVLFGHRRGEVAVVTEVRPSPNVAVRRDRAFTVSPADLARALTAARRDGRELVGFFHSHPTGDARASTADLRGSWRGTRVVVVAPAAPDAVAVRSFRAVAGALYEEPVIG